MGGPEKERHVSKVKLAYVEGVTVSSDDCRIVNGLLAYGN